MRLLNGPAKFGFRRKLRHEQPMLPARGVTKTRGPPCFIAGIIRVLVLNQEQPTNSLIQLISGSSKSQESRQPMDGFELLSKLEEDTNGFLSAHDFVPARCGLAPIHTYIHTCIRTYMHSCDVPWAAQDNQVGFMSPTT